MASHRRIPVAASRISSPSTGTPGAGRAFCVAGIRGSAGAGQETFPPLHLTARSPIAPPRPRRRTRDHVHALADWPQVHDLGFHAREAVAVSADLAVLVAVHAA